MLTSLREEASGPRQQRRQVCLEIPSKWSSWAHHPGTQELVGGPTDQGSSKYCFKLIDTMPGRKGGAFFIHEKQYT